MAKNLMVFFSEELERKGGSGSGNFGHAGRPGQVGGSAEGAGGGAKPVTSAQRFQAVLSKAKAAAGPVGGKGEATDKTTMSIRWPHVDNAGNIQQDVVGTSVTGKYIASISGMSDNINFLVMEGEVGGALKRVGVADNYDTALDWATASVSDLMYR